METRNTLDTSTLSGTSASFDGLGDFDNTVAFNDSLALDKEPLFSVDWDGETPPYDGGLYSTPLNWDLPEPKIEELPALPFSAPYTVMNRGSVLTPAQQEKLANIAMPARLQYRNRGSPGSNASGRKSRSVSSPDSNANSRKRKSSAEIDDEDDEDSSGQHPPVKKTAHNMIEKRYRTKLNDKIAALRDSVPSLRIMSKSTRGEDTNDDREDLQGLTPAHKLNKATVLSKATEYIRHLEKQNIRLIGENNYMKGRIDAFEELFMAGSMGMNPTPQYTEPFQYPQQYVDTPGPSPTGEPQGMILVPENIRRLQVSQQQIYPVTQEQFQQQQQRQRQAVGPNGWQTGGYFGRLMVGSLAGLMIMEGFHEAEQDTETPGARGLFAFPTQLLSTVSESLHSSMNINVAGYHIPAAQTLGYTKTLLVLGALLYVFLPSLFFPKQKGKSKTQGASLSAAPSLASSIQIRRQAWLTAIQTVWVPRHNFFLEAAALCLKMVKLSTRNVIGSQGYAYLTGITEQQEAARVKAWEIALDAQLAGGDVEVSKSRLTLTLLASGTLPDTPARLMLKALHIRVLLWEVGNAGFSGFYMFQEIAAKLARWKWNEARQLQRMMTHMKDPQADELPKYLAVLLEQECDDVLVDSIGQRAYNLAWNLPTTHNSHGAIDGMDGVVEDFAIRSPLDAVAAWWSSLILHRALASSLQKNVNDASVQESIRDYMALANETAPTGCTAQIRALVARAVLVTEKRGATIAAVLKALGPTQQAGSVTEAVPTLINTAASIAALPDIQLSLSCAMAIAHLEKYPSPQNPTPAHRIINSVIPANLTPLGFTAAFNLMEAIDQHELVAASCTRALERLAGGLRIWIGSKGGQASGLDQEIKRDMVARSTDIIKRIVGMKDAGYESMTEEDASAGC